jgi:predicted small integral membrane protein
MVGGSKPRRSALKSLLGPSAQHYAWCGLAAQAPLFSAGVDAVLSALALVYAGAAAWHHRRPTQKQGVCFAAGLLVLGATLTGPLERLALERLFVAYIFQQFVAVMIAAPLLLLGLPDWMARAVFMNRVIQHYAFHHYCEIFRDGKRELSLLFTEEIVSKEVEYVDYRGDLGLVSSSHSCAEHL